MNKKWTDDQIIEAVGKNFSIRGVLRDIGLKYSGSNFVTVKDAVARLGLDTKHWTGRGHLIGKHHFWPKAKPLSEMLIDDCKISRRTIKARLIKEGLLKNECMVCKQGNDWKGKPLVMVLDHIDGRKNNYRVENLRLLCPNCNSQTETFSGRNNKGKNYRPKEKFECEKCHKPLSGKTITGMCFKCMDRKNVVVKKIPSSLMEDVMNIGIRASARKYKVSHSTVGRWIRNAHVPELA